MSQADDLVLPKHRRMVVQYSTDEAGVTELHLYYGDKDISFAESDLFPFGETLAKQARFTAGDATRWGAGYEWPRVQDLLQQLIDEGILVHAIGVERQTASAGDAIRPSPLPPSACPVARSWDECEAITQELAGRPVELGYLELIVPVFRVAHIALDADQRQVGEANVFPPALRLDVPTEWRTCNLPGSRYQDERPMNVTAMRVMRAHWSQMMAAALRVREGYLRRFPEAEGAWTVGHLERLSAAVLAVPTYQLVRRHHRVGNGELHPALSSLFRVTDGVRMTMHRMLFDPANEPTRPPHQGVTVDDILDYAERNNSFHSTHGVCAGPGAMVRELIQILLEGRGSADYAHVAFEPAVQAAFDDLDAAIDYGFHGLRAYAAVFSLWPMMARAYEQIAATVEAWPSADAPVVAALREGMRAHCEALLRTNLAHERWRADRGGAYADMYCQCGRGLAGLADAPGLDALLTPVWTSAHRQTEAELQDILRSRFDGASETSEAFVQNLSARVMDFLLREQAVLRTGAAVQSDINRLLGREQPKRAIRAADIKVYNVMLGPDLDHLPHLIDELERLLGLRIELDRNSLTIAGRDTAP
ncbi:MAG TPA: hypothetical protein VJ779_07180 [Acetobacteraceae bacterium]|nr:hypothetical protein [Acetobacteraceae bacterium]